MVWRHCCPGDVSGKTSFLVVGDQCSRRKFDKVRGPCPPT